MKKHFVIILVIAIAVAAATAPLCAEKTATQAEARNVATNWISVIMRSQGSWGDAATAEVGEIELFQQAGRTVGYLCHIKPKGHIVVSFLKGLAPVKAYSTTDNLCNAEEGLPDLLKRKMRNLIDALEEKLTQTGSFKTQSFDDIVDINYLELWDRLMQDPQVFDKEATSFGTRDNYSQGEILLSTNWCQGDPYNRQVPEASGGCSAAHCTVGCVALAASQIMRYWFWPPYGSGSPYDDVYNWTDMPDEIDDDSPQNQINAVANLCAEVGQAVDMEYCSDECASSAITSDMEDAYEQHFRYSNYCTKLDRDDYDTNGWWDEIKIQLHSNQPMQYRVVGHSLVCDGWRITNTIRQYHMNLGWAGGHPDKPCWEDFTNTNTWYILDALPCSELSEEYMMVNIYPVVSLRHAPEGHYPRNSFNYRYVNQDCSGTNVTFDAGQNIQFLPRVIMKCGSGYVDINGTGSYPTMLFTRGDRTQGVVIHNGRFTLYPGGGIRLP